MNAASTTPDRLARALGIDRDVVLDAILDGRIDATTESGRWCISPDEAERFRRSLGCSENAA